MAIEFHCPGCGKLMRTPDETAGRKGKCPSCGIKVQIPGTSLTSSRNEIDLNSRTPSAAGAASGSSHGPIQFACGSCQNLLSVPASAAGKKGKCPRCGAVMAIPAREATPAVGAGIPKAPSSSTSTRWKDSSTAPASPSVRLQFSCPQCGKLIKVAASAAGKQGQCPQCRSVITIPATVANAPKRARAPAPQSPPGSAGLTPLTPGLTPTTPGLTPLTPGLTPTSPGLTPVTPGLTPVTPGLTPVTPGLTPVNPGRTPVSPGSNPFDNFGSSPLGAANDPFAGLPSVGAAPPAQGFNDLTSFLGSAPLGNPGMPAASPFPSPANPYAANPYASPATYSQAAPSSQHAGKPKRTGLPWDRKAEGAFWNTAKMVLFSPKEAFYRMSLVGGFGRPMLFCVTGVMIGGFFGVIYNLFAQVGVLLMGRGGGGAAMVGVVIGTVVGAAVGLGVAAIFAVIMSFMYAGVLHVCLLMVGGARQSFETTYRICCYAMGACALCNAVPCVGGLAAAVFQLAALINGCWTGHEIPLWKAVVAVLIPYAVMLVVVIACVVVIIMAVMQRGAGA